MLVQQAVSLFDATGLRTSITPDGADWLGLTGRAARRAGTTSIEEDFQRLPIRDQELYLRFRNELDVCREAMLPHLEYRR
jgi:hypothetical protein